MNFQQIHGGLWTWTLPHPDWKPENDRPGGWGQMVASVYYEPSTAFLTDRPKQGPGSGDQEAVALIDPLAPPEGRPDSEPFWKALDRDFERAGRHVAILLGNEFHSRSASSVFERYRGKGPGASLWGHETLRSRPGFGLTRTFAGEQPLPAGVQGYPLPSLSEGEIALYIPEHRTLVFADAVIGVGEGRLRVCPPSWAAEAPRYHEEFRSSIRRLLDLALDRVLVSHGPPALQDGRGALAEALDSPAWGE